MDTQGWFLPFFIPFIWLSIRRTSLLDGHLVAVLKASVLESVDCRLISGGILWLAVLNDTKLS